jgi:hypothetical protein
MSSPQETARDQFQRNVEALAAVPADGEPTRVSPFPTPVFGGGGRRLRIISAGDPMTTRVVDRDTGEDVRGVTRVEWGIRSQSLAWARVELEAVEFDVTAEFHTDPATYRRLERMLPRERLNGARDQMRHAHAAFDEAAALVSDLTGIVYGLAQVFAERDAHGQRQPAHEQNERADHLRDAFLRGDVTPAWRAVDAMRARIAGMSQVLRDIQHHFARTSGLGPTWSPEEFASHHEDVAALDRDITRVLGQDAYALNPDADERTRVLDEAEQAAPRRPQAPAETSHV